MFLGMYVQYARRNKSESLNDLFFFLLLLLLTFGLIQCTRMRMEEKRKERKRKIWRKRKREQQLFFFPPPLPSLPKFDAKWGAKLIRKKKKEGTGGKEEEEEDAWDFLGTLYTLVLGKTVACVRPKNLFGGVPPILDRDRLPSPKKFSIQSQLFLFQTTDGRWGIG